MKGRHHSTHPVATARRATRRRLEGDEEAGFTLIELVIVIAIMPIVIGAIALALLSVFGLQNQTNNRISDSNDELLSATNFSRDVQSAAQLTYQSTPGCGASTQTQVLGLEWGQNNSVPGLYQTVVSYVIKSTVNSVGQTTYSLVRQQCFSGTSTVLTSENSTTQAVSHDISSSMVPVSPNPSTALHICGSANAVTNNHCGLSETAGNFPEITSGFSAWKSTQGVTKVELDITEPNSNFLYSLVGLPSAGASQGTPTTPSPPTTNNDCNFANPGTGDYAGQLCFVDFTGFNPAYSGSTAQCGSSQPMSGSVAGTPYSISFCISAAQNTYDPSTFTPKIQPTAWPIPTYGTDAGFGSEAFLGNNGFYTGIPGNPALYQKVNSNGHSGTSGNEFQMSVIYITNFQVLDAADQPATGWTLVTGDAESTDSGEWMVFQNNTVINGTPINWSVLDNSGPSDPYGNACYDSTDAAPNYGFMQYTGTNGAGLAAGTAIPSTDKKALNQANFPATGTTSVLCETNSADPHLNKTGTLMLSSQEPTTSSSAQSITVTMNGEGNGEALFLGILL